MSIGRTSSYDPTGTIALSPPFTEVLNINLEGCSNEEINTFNFECKFEPGINQFKNISLASSGIAEIRES
jgi:hypothetical protein